MTDHWGAAVRDGVGKFERYFKKKGWFGFSNTDNAGAQGLRLVEENTRELLEQWELGTDPKYKTLVEIGLAWAITKAMLPVRIIASVWAAPWFARAFIMPFLKRKS